MGSLDEASQLSLVGSYGSPRAIRAEMKKLARRALGRLPETPKTEAQYVVSYPFDSDLAWVAANYARVPSRAYWDLKAIESHRLEPLYDEVRQWVETLVLPGPAWLKSELGISVEAKDSQLFEAGTRQMRGTIKNALIDGGAKLGCTLELHPEGFDRLFTLRQQGDQLFLSIDLGGQSLHRRGQRTQVVEASLKETLAAQMLIYARYNPKTPLVDPMAGAGTIVLEAASAARGLPTISPERVHYLRPKDLHCSPLFADACPKLLANDIDPRAIRALEKNASSLPGGLEIETHTGDFENLDLSDFTRKTPPLILTNPPYGKRLGDPSEAVETCQRLIRWAKKEAPGGQLGMLLPPETLPESPEFRFRSKNHLRNGADPVEFVLFDL